MECVNKYSNIFDVLQIPITNLSRQVTLAYKKIIRLYHPDNWNSTEVLSKFESEENFKELAIIYEDIIENVCFY